MYLHACQVRVTVGHSGLCCVCVTSFERELTPLCVDYLWNRCVFVVSCVFSVRKNVQEFELYVGQS